MAPRTCPAFLQALQRVDLATEHPESDKEKGGKFISEMPPEF
jgi:hypothetical protein